MSRHDDLIEDYAAITIGNACIPVIYNDGRISNFVDQFQL